MKIIFVLTLLYISVRGSVYAFSAGSGSSGAQFLKIPVSARIAAIGSSFAGLSDSVYSIYWNPSGLIRITQKEIAATYVQLPAEIGYSFIGYAQPVSTDIALGVGVIYSYIGLQLTDIGGKPTGQNISLSDAVIILSYSQKGILKFLQDLSAGVTIKTIRQQIFDRSSMAFAIDMGVLHQIKKISMGLSIQNIGTRIKFAERSYPLPSVIRLGGAYKVHIDEFLINLSAEGNKFLDSNPKLGIGAEIWFKNIIAARIGYEISAGSRDSKLSAGIGFKYTQKETERLSALEYSIDYALAHMKYLGMNHYVTAGIRF